jgi:hypothetical protein
MGQRNHDKKKDVKPKKTWKPEKIEKIEFNIADRKEFITGFRKRKIARTKATKEKYALIAKEEKREERQEKSTRKREMIHGEIERIDKVANAGKRKLRDDYMALQEGENVTVTSTQNEDGTISEVTVVN